MEEKQSSVQAGEEENADSSKTGEGEGAASESFTVPRRNAEYWEAAQKRREAQRARADFFKSHKKPDGEGEGEDQEDDEDHPLTRREYEQLREQDRLSFQEEVDRKVMSQSDETAIDSFLSKAEHKKFQKYEKQARAILKDPAYAHADIPLIFRGLAYDDALAEGATQGAKANEKIARNSSGGFGKRQEPEVSGYDPDKHKEFKKKLRSGKVSFGSPE